MALMIDVTNSLIVIMASEVGSQGTENSMQLNEDSMFRL